MERTAKIIGEDDRGIGAPFFVAGSLATNPGCITHDPFNELGASFPILIGTDEALTIS